ncbi:MAG: Rieske (2Fe-2S) protein [Prolixibacteraceae bacterium]|nr:Rieske (2Fe-2S) protein [Prolixibacteraceae bacterium]
MKLKSRRLFLRVIIVAIASFSIFIWNRLTLELLKKDKLKTISFPFVKNKTISFEDDFIIVNQDETTIVFSAHCTHLGCKIDKTKDGKLVCPCHGSEYDLYGKILKGPAYKNLKSVDFRISHDGKNIIIEG